MTVNMAGASGTHGRWQDRIARIASAVEAASVDVVLAQAAMSADEGPFEMLGRALAGFALKHFAPMAEQDGGSAGLAIFARSGVSHFRTAPIGSGPADPQERILLCAVTDDGEPPIHLINCYTSWIEDIAETNVRAILSFCESLSGPVLLGGDFNQLPASPAMRALERAGFVDAWALLRHGQAGATFPSDDPLSRIDYFWLNAELVRRARAIDLADGEGGVLSDHRALMLELAA